MPDRYYYIIANGTIAGQGDTRIDPPDTLHQDYVDGNLSIYWDALWVRRIDGTIDGYPGNGQNWDLVNDTWFWPKTALHATRVTTRNNLINTTITTHGITLAALDSVISQLDAFADDAENEDGADSRAFLLPGMTTSVNLTNTQFLAVYNALKARNQLIKDVDASVYAQIENSTITNFVQLDAGFSTGMSTPPVTRDQLPNVRTQISDLQGVDTATDERLDDIEAVTAPQQTGIADPSASTQDGAATNAATNNPIDAPTNINVLTVLLLNGAINDANARQNTIGGNLNALAGKYNDLAAKHNQLVADHNALKDKVIALISRLEVSGTIATL